MTKFDKDTVTRFRGMARSWLAQNTDITERDVETGRTAWEVAHRCGITREAYADRTVTDGHIQTALEQIFPNAVFRDKKAY